MDLEMWKRISDKYAVSNYGRVKSDYFKRPRVIKNCKVKSGYEVVSLWSQRQKRKVYVHRLVANAFVPNPENKPEVNHINGVKSDNRAENLEWVTRQENTQHAHDSGLTSPAKGESHGRCRLSEADIKQIRLDYRRGSTQKELALKNNVSRGHIGQIVRNKRWVHV